MQKVFENPGQVDLIKDIAKWQEENVTGDYSLFIEAIMFLPWYQGKCKAIVNYRPAEPICTDPHIVVAEKPRCYSSGNSEQSVFSAMAGGTDGG